MEENTFITPSCCDDELFSRLNELLEKTRGSITGMAEQIINETIPIIQASTEWLKQFYSQMLCAVATPREWYLMNHAKRWRTRKKYRNRLALRLAAAIRLEEDGAEDSNLQ